MSKQPLHRLDDPDFRNAEIALYRAAKVAQERARRFGCEPVVRKNAENQKEQDVKQENSYEQQNQ